MEDLDVARVFYTLTDAVRSQDLAPVTRVSLEKSIKEAEESVESSFRRARFLRGRGAAFVFAMATFCILLGILVGGAFVSRELPFDQTWPYFLATALVILVASVAKDRYFERSMLRAADDLRAENKECWTDIQEWLEETLAPAVFSKAGRDEVLRAAAELIVTARKEEDTYSNFVVYLGSAALDTDLAEDEDEADEEGPLAEYRNAVALLEANDTRVIRYIRLLTPKRFSTRGADFRQNYENWIERQISLLAANPRYSVIHSRRALPWGSARSTILTRRAVLDIVGHGESGILIRSEDVAADLHKGAKTLFGKAENVPRTYNKRLLEEYLESLRAVPVNENGDNAEEEN